MQYLRTMDEVLLNAFREGDPEAVRAVYREFAGPVAAVARSIVGNDHLVDDIVQQTFTKAWKAAQTFDPSRRFAPWLFSIARRTAIDAVRSERRPHVGGHEPEADLAVGPPSFARAWEAYEVRRAIDVLPEDERVIVELSYRLGLTQREIAEHLDVPIGTVKSRSHKAHRRLSVILAHLREQDVVPPLDADERRNIG
ncbi:MAG: RNA polymerase sigma factor [Acidimicrobiales bacterium]